MQKAFGTADKFAAKWDSTQKPVARTKRKEYNNIRKGIVFMTNALPYKPEYLERIKRFRLIDDTFMSKVFEDIPCAEYLLQTILENPNLRVKEVRTQNEIKNLQGRSVRLDIKVVDENNHLYDVEVQRADEGAGAKRARHNSSMMDANVLNTGTKPEALPTTYVIFITESDVLKKNLPLYHIDRVIRETGEYFQDDQHIIYVNGSYRGGGPISDLMEDFFCSNPDQMHSNVLAERTRHFKTSEKGVSSMCQIMEDLRTESLEEGRVQTLCELVYVGDMSFERAQKHLNFTPKQLITKMQKLYPDWTPTR